MAISTFMLELSEQEMVCLWALLVLLDASGKLDEPEQAILDRLQRLMEGK